MIAKIEIRPAIPQDFKLDLNVLKVGQPYLILDENHERVLIHDYITHTMDLDIFKIYLDQNRVYVPMSNYSFKQFLKAP